MKSTTVKFMLLTIALACIRPSYAALILNEGSPYDHRTHVMDINGTNFVTEGFYDYGDFVIESFRVFDYSYSSAFYFHATSTSASCHQHASGCYLTFAQNGTNPETGEQNGVIAQGVKIYRKDAGLFDFSGVEVKYRNTSPLLGYNLGEAYLLAGDSFDPTRQFNETMDQHNILDYNMKTPDLFRIVDFGSNKYSGIEQLYLFSNNEFNYKTLFVEAHEEDVVAVSEPQTLLTLLLGLFGLATLRLSKR